MGEIGAPDLDPVFCFRLPGQHDLHGIKDGADAVADGNCFDIARSTGTEQIGGLQAGDSDCHLAVADIGQAVRRIRVDRLVLARAHAKAEAAAQRDFRRRLTAAF